MNGARHAEALDEQTAANKGDDREGHSRCHQNASQPLRPAARSSSAATLLQRFVDVLSGRVQRRRQSGDESYAESQREGEQQHPKIDRRAAQIRTRGGWKKV